jgi:outer membrane receptor protein involved in Fe transport
MIPRSFQLAGLLFISAAGLLAQRTTANIYGVVTDNSGAVVPAASVVLLNQRTGVEQRLHANEVGEFSATFVPVGIYTLRVEAKGFKTFVREGLELTAGQQFRYPVTLELGDVAQQLVVTGEAPLLQNASAQLNDGITRAQLDDLPATNRDFTQLLNLQTGVVRASRELFQINGLASAGITVTVDGVDAAGNAETSLISLFQGANEINVVSQEAIAEVNVAKGVYSAEIGRAYSGNINVITKSGTNQFHGSLFENWRNDVLNARYALFTPADRKLPIRFHQFGGSLGGPVVKDRAFFFFAYEAYRQRNFAVLQGLVPTPEFRARAVAAVPAYKAILDVFPTPTQSYAAGAASGFYQSAGFDRGHDNHFVWRGDWHLNSTNRLTGRYTRGRPLRSTSSLVQTNPQTYDYAVDSANASWVSSTPTWSSETRLGLNFSDTTRINAAYHTGIPGIEIQGNFAIGAENLLVTGHSYSVEEIVAKTTGHHTIKFGGTYFVQAPGRFDEEIPVFRYGTPNDFLANNPNRVQFTFGIPRFHGKSWQLAGFVQDDFRVRQNLVLNLGVRYEYYSVFSDKERLLLNAGSLSNAFAIPARYRPPDSFYNADRNNFLPRAGLAWSPGGGGKTVVRSGFGVMVAPMDLRNFYTLVAYDPQIIFRYRFTGSDITRLNLRYPITNPQALNFIRTTTVPRSFEIFDENNPNPYSMQWTLDVQRQVTSTLVWQGGYVGTRGVKVSMSRNINQPDRFTGVRPFPHAIESNLRDASDTSTYHAFQTVLHNRFSHNLFFNINYTWSKALAVSQGDYYGGNDPEVQDETKLRADWGPVAQDRRHVFALDYGYTLPVDRWAKAGASRLLLGGWQIGGILRAATGSPLTVTQASGFPISRPDFAGGDPYLNTGNRFLSLNPAAFAAVPLSPVARLPIRPGNVGKGSLRGPGFWNLDLSLSKSFQFSERYHLRFRAEMFNSLNHVNLGNPIVELTRFDFGQVRTVGAARTMQLALRFHF